jgi:FkbM family methyltransferase
MCLYSGTLDSSGVSAAVKKHGCFECGLVRFMLQRLRDASSRHGATLVDIGANVGMYTLAAAAAGHTAHAFEPTPLTVQKLLRSIEVNGFGPLVTLYPMCLGASRAAVALAKSDNNQGFLSHRAGAGRVQLPMLRLDDVLAPIEARDVFLKMDIEGGECEAEKGMQAFLNRTRRIVGAVMEFGRVTPECCLRWMQPNGFFHRLHWRDGLCPRASSGLQRLPFEQLCEVKKPWDLVWDPC